MTKVFINKIYHCYLKRKYENSAIIGEKKTEEILEKLNKLLIIEPISFTDLDYMGKKFYEYISSEYFETPIKIFNVIENDLTDTFYQYYSERYVGKLKIYIYLTSNSSLHSNCDLLDCKLQIMKGISKSEADKKTYMYWSYLDMLHQYDVIENKMVNKSKAKLNKAES